MEVGGLENVVALEHVTNYYNHYTCIIEKHLSQSFGLARNHFFAPPKRDSRQAGMTKNEVL